MNIRNQYAGARATYRARTSHKSDMEFLFNRLMLLPVELRRAAARCLLWDLNQSKTAMAIRLAEISECSRLDDDFTYSVEDYRCALIIVGYHPAKAQIRSRIYEAQLDRQLKGSSPSEMRRLELAL